MKRIRISIQILTLVRRNHINWDINKYVLLLNSIWAIYNRNEYFINSHHPLKETLINQTGNTPAIRRKYLHDLYQASLDTLFHTWSPLIIFDREI